MIPSGVIQVRTDICGDCPTPCSPRPDPASPCSACAIKRWGTWGACSPEAVKSAPMRGLGDLVAKFADPIAKAIGMDKTKCGCAGRQAALNARFPFTP